MSDHDVPNPAAGKFWCVNCGKVHGEPVPCGEDEPQDTGRAHDVEPAAGKCATCDKEIDNDFGVGHCTACCGRYAELHGAPGGHPARDFNAVAYFSGSPAAADPKDADPIADFGGFEDLPVLDREAFASQFAYGSSPLVPAIRAIVESLAKSCGTVDAETAATWACLVGEALKKPIRPVLQLDAFDDDDSDLWAGLQYDLRASTIPVRVQVVGGTDKDTAVRLLLKLATWLHRDWERLTTGHHLEWTSKSPAEVSR